MKSLTDFLSKLVFLFVAMGFICSALMFRSCESIASNVGPKVEMGIIPDDFGLTHVNYANTPHHSFKELDHLRIKVEDQQLEIAHLRSELGREEKRANELARDLEEVSEQLTLKEIALKETQATLVDSCLVLSELRTEYASLKLEYEAEMQSHMETLTKLLAANDTIQQQRTLIKQLEQEKAQAKQAEKNILIAFMIVVIAVLVCSVLFWFKMRGGELKLTNYSAVK